MINNYTTDFLKLNWIKHFPDKYVYVDFKSSVPYAYHIIVFYLFP